jgi:hypothetical protein
VKVTLENISAEKERKMKSTRDEVKAALAFGEDFNRVLKTWLTADDAIAALPEKQKALKQTAAELEVLEKKKAKATAELATRETELKDLSAKVDAFRAEHGLAMRYSELLEKVKEQENLLRVANSKFAAMVKKVDALSEVRR